MTTPPGDLPDDTDRTDQATIARVYDRHAAVEYGRLDRTLRHHAELALSTDLLDELVAPGAEVRRRCTSSASPDAPPPRDPRDRVDS